MSYRALAKLWSPFAVLPIGLFRLLFFVGVVVALGAGVYQLNELWQTNKKLQLNPVVEAVAYTEPVKFAITQKLEGAKSASQAALLAIGVLWGLIIAKKDERALLFGDWPELFSFFIANAFLCVSLWCYLEYTDAMAGIHALGVVQYDPPDMTTIMDYRDERVNAFHIWQTRFLFIGVTTAAITLFSAHMLKPKQMETK